jgi:hypothetical protein
MSRVAYDDQTLTRYLLGSLGGPEAERLDELSVTDDEVAEALRAAEKDLIDAYVEGELRGAALEQFESHYMASPLRRERVEFARAFRLLAERSAAARAAEGGATAPAEPAPARKAPGVFSASGGLRFPRPAWRWGIASAALALLVAAGWLLFERARPRAGADRARTEGTAPDGRQTPERPEGRRAPGAEAGEELARGGEGDARPAEASRTDERGPAEERRAEAPREAAREREARPRRSAVASFVLSPQVRGVGELRTISVPAEASDVAMRLELEPSDYTAYRVALLDRPGGRTLWRSRRLGARAAGGAKFLAIRFPAGLLRRQTYVLQVTGVAVGAPPEIVGDYPFRVMK